MKKSLFYVFSIIFIAISLSGHSQKSRPKYIDYTYKDGSIYRYTRPKPFRFILNTPKTLATVAKQPFQKKNWEKTGAMIVGTALLVAIDQPLIDGAQQFGRFIGLSTDRSTTTLFKLNIFGQSAPIEVPSSFSSAIYYIGEGWTSVFTTLGFYSVGLIKKNYRALQTASQLAQTMINVGIVAQFFKRTTGRESPFRATRPGGEWRPFPAPATYAKSVSRYDAFPSGHMATLAGTFTVIILNYPDSKILKYIAAGTMALVGYQMMNNGVHWFSDYPLAIAIGYGLGKIAVNQGREKVVSKELQGMMKRKGTWKISPQYSPMGTGMLSLTYFFP